MAVVPCLGKNAQINSKLDFFKFFLSELNWPYRVQGMI